MASWYIKLYGVYIIVHTFMANFTNKMPAETWLELRMVDARKQRANQEGTGRVVYW